MQGTSYTRADRELAKDCYVSGQFPSVKRIAEHLGIARSTLERWRQDDSWDLARARVEREREQAMVSNAVENLHPLDREHYEFFRKLLALGQESMDAMIELVTQAKEDGNPLLRLAAIDTKRLRDLAAVGSTGQVGQRLAAGRDKTTEEPVIRVELADMEGTIREALERGILPGSPKGELEHEPSQETSDDDRGPEPEGPAG